MVENVFTAISVFAMLLSKQIKKETNKRTKNIYCIQCICYSTEQTDKQRNINYYFYCIQCICDVTEQTDKERKKQKPNKLRLHVPPQASQLCYKYS